MHRRLRAEQRARHAAERNSRQADRVSQLSAALAHAQRYGMGKFVPNRFFHLLTTAADMQ